MTQETLTVFTPVALLPEALPLAVALGVAAGDAADGWTGTFFAAFADADGNEWRGLSLTRDLSPVMAALGGEMPTPELTAARAKLLAWRPPEPAPDDDTAEAPPHPPVPTATAHPAAIIAIIGLPARAALKAVGLQPKPVE